MACTGKQGHSKGNLYIICPMACVMGCVVSIAMWTRGKAVAHVFSQSLCCRFVLMTSANAVRSLRMMETMHSMGFGKCPIQSSYHHLLTDAYTAFWGVCSVMQCGIIINANSCRPSIAWQSTILELKQIKDLCIFVCCTTGGNHSNLIMP